MTKHNTPHLHYVSESKRLLTLLKIIAIIVLVGYSKGFANSLPQQQTDPTVAKLGKGFVSATAKVNGATIHYVRGGKGPAIILVHGFPQSWYEYHKIMPRLAKRFTVIAVDLRGIGGSKPTPGGYDAANMAEDIYQLASTLKLERIYLVGHDVGGMVTYAFIRRYPQILRGAMILDVPIPGIAGWDEIQGDPSVWHVRFMQTPELPEKLVAGRQVDYFSYFFHFGKFTPADIAHYAKAYGTVAQLHAMFEMYRAFPANAEFNQAQRGQNDVPVFLASGDKSPFVKIVPKIAEGLRANGLTHVETGIIPDSVHYVVEDNPDAVAEFIERYASL